MNFNKSIKEAIAKGAARVVRKPMSTIRHNVADLKNQVMELRRGLRDLQRVIGYSASGSETAGEEVELMRVRRPTATGIKRMRTKLGLTQTQFAKLLGVTALSVSKWERAAGSVNVRSRTLAAIRRVRSLGKRQVLKMLQG